MYMFKKQRMVIHSNAYTGFRRGEYKYQSFTHTMNDTQTHNTRQKNFTQSAHKSRQFESKPSHIGMKLLNDALSLYLCN